MPKAKLPASEAAPDAPVIDAVQAPVVEQHVAEQSAQPSPPDEQAPDAPAASLPEAAPTTPELVKARVLSHCEHGAPNDVVEIDPALAKSLDGVVDTDPAAVAYAESLK